MDTWTQRAAYSASFPAYFPVTFNLGYSARREQHCCTKETIGDKSEVRESRRIVSQTYGSFIPLRLKWLTPLITPNTVIHLGTAYLSGITKFRIRPDTKPFIAITFSLMSPGYHFPCLEILFMPLTYVMIPSFSICHAVEREIKLSNSERETLFLSKVSRWMCPSLLISDVLRNQLRKWALENCGSQYNVLALVMSCWKKSLLIKAARRATGYF